MKDSVLWAIFKRALSAAVLAMLIYGPVWGQATRRDINQIRRKDNLTPQDIQSLKEFIQIQFGLMESATEPTQLNQPIKELEEISTSQSSNPPAQQQYSEEFARAVQAGYETVFQRGQALAQQESEDQKKLGEHLKLAAVLPLATSNHPVIIDDLLKYLLDDSPDVRQCVVKGLAQDNIQRQLAQAEATDAQVQKVLNGLAKCLEPENSPEVIMQIAAAVNLPGKADGLVILRECASKRAGQYRSWQVSNESADAEIMRQILTAAERELAANDRRTTVDLLRSATEMFWVVYQRYSRGKAYRTADNKVLPLLSEQSQQILKTIMILGEQDIIRLCNKVRNNPPARNLFMQALQEQNDANLNTAYEALLGAGGVVQQAFSIYDGWTAPADFPEPPADVVKKAENLLKIKQNTIIGNIIN